MSRGASRSESEEDLEEVRLRLGLGSVNLKGIPDGDSGDGNKHRYEHKGSGNIVSEAAPAPNDDRKNSAETECIPLHVKPIPLVECMCKQ